MFLASFLAVGVFRCFPGEFPSPSRSSASVAKADNAGSRTIRRVSTSSRPAASSKQTQQTRSNATTGPRHMLPMFSLSLSFSLDDERYLDADRFVGKVLQRLLYPAPPTRLCLPRVFLASGRDIFRERIERISQPISQTVRQPIWILHRCFTADFRSAGGGKDNEREVCG